MTHIQYKLPWILLLIVISCRITPSDEASDYDDEADDDFNYYADDDMDDDDDAFLDSADEFGYGDVYKFDEEEEVGFASTGAKKKIKKEDLFAKDDFQLAQEQLRFKSNTPGLHPDEESEVASLQDDHKEFNPRDKHPGAGMSNGHDRMDRTHTSLIHDHRYDGDQYGGDDMPPYMQGPVKPIHTQYDPDFDGSHVNHIPYQPAKGKGKKSPLGGKGGFHVANHAGQQAPIGALQKPKPPFMRAVPVHPAAVPARPPPPPPPPVEQERDFYDTSATGEDAGGGGLHFSSGKDKIDSGLQFEADNKDEEVDYYSDL